MPRLPQPGADAGDWGDILNDFLLTSLSNDGSLNVSTVGAPQLKPGAVTSSAISAGQVTSVKIADEAVTTPKLADSSVSSVKLKDTNTAGGALILDGSAKVPELHIPTRLSDANLRGLSEEVIDDRVPGQVVAALADDDTIATAAAEAVSSDLAGRNIPTAETLDDDEFMVRFDDGEAFLQANETLGIHDTKIAHLDNSVPASATTFTKTLSDDQGWLFVIAYQDGEVAFGQRTDGSWYPDNLGGEVATLTQVTIHGDSLTANWGSSTAGLATELGRTVTARGNGGHTSKFVAVRQGGEPMRVTVSGGVIPASGPIDVTFAFGTNIGTTGAGAPPSATGTYNGVLGTVAGALTITDDGIGTFTRISNGPTRLVPNGTPFTTGYTWRDSLPIFWAGRNNFKLANDGQQIISDLKAMMAWTNRSDRALILSIPPWLGEEIGSGVRATLDSVNALIQNTFPTAYVDTAALLRDSTLLTAVGVTPTATDLDNISNGLTPESFRADAGHLNATGYAALNILIKEIYTARGWMED